MTPVRVLPLLLAGALALPAVPPGWEKALQSARASVSQNSGFAAVVLLERTDPQTVAIQLQTFGTTVKKAVFRARAEGRTLPALSLESGKGMESLSGSAVLNEQFTEMEVSLEGEDFRPRMLLRIPRPGEKAEVGSIHMGTRAK